MRKKQRFSNGIKTFLKKVNTPPSWVITIAYASAVLLSAFAVIALATEKRWSAAAFVIYASALLAVVYSGWITVRFVKKLSDKVSDFADKYTFTRNLKTDYGFQTAFFGACSFVGNVAYTVFLCITALYSGATWYWALAAYYLFLIAVRGGVLLEKRSQDRKYRNKPLYLKRERIRTYSFCGTMLIALTLALMVVFLEMIVDGQRLQTVNFTIYAFVAFTAYRMVMAAYHFLKSKRYQDLAVRAVRNINLATALVTLFSLQTALLDAFSTPERARIWNAVTGALVCALVVAIGVYMLISASQKKKKVMEKIALLARQSAGYNREDYSVEYGNGEET